MSHSLILISQLNVFVIKKVSNLIARPPPIPIALLARAPRWGRIDFDSAWEKKYLNWFWFWWKPKEKVLCCQLTMKSFLCRQDTSGTTSNMTMASRRANPKALESFILVFSPPLQNWRDFKFLNPDAVWVKACDALLASRSSTPCYKEHSSTPLLSATDLNDAQTKLSFHPVCGANLYLHGYQLTMSHGAGKHNIQ